MYRVTGEKPPDKSPPDEKLGQASLGFKPGAFHRGVKSPRYTPLGKFTLPEVNFQVNTYTHMISLITPNTDLLILSEYTVEVLNLISEECKVPEEVYELPCHNQKVERVIKLVNETATKTISQRNREGIIQCSCLKRGIAQI